MPIVICETHGRAIAPHGCRHVAECVWARRHPGHTTHVDLDGFFFTGWICDACLNVLDSKGLQPYLARHKGFHDYPPEEQIDPLIDGLDLQPMCAKCFEELSKASFQSTKIERQ